MNRRTTTPTPAVPVPDQLVQAALRAAEDLDRDVADVPIAAIAERAGMSRATLFRRLGGSRAALHEAVRVAGVDPGGQSVRVRAVDAAAVLISEAGLASVTLEAIAARAGCAVESLYTVFGNRDTLLGAVFDQYNPIAAICEVLSTEHADLATTVGHIYRSVAEAFGREPRVGPAIFAELLARPASPTVQSLLNHNAPRLFGVIGAWLDAEIRAGRIRDLPVPLLMNQLFAPMVIHTLLRPAMARVPSLDLPDVDQACDLLTDTFIRAVATDPARPTPPDHEPNSAGTA